ncbi:nucleoside hydrolase [Alteromonas gilva]|uniref:Nucleoside hydrolase n=1 Tax=Alteromonas gilva TaxID=2987522 RepID=A0ABT5L2P3_9ALTE|nr:nucleoside hydrolase [Alteromonas gilva]MDC8831315.1 nucleoside hydrolase [Alteromonas gilva]
MNKNKKQVVFDHDGGIDDLLSLMFLLCMDEVELIGVCVTPADCYPDDAVESTLKILAMFNQQDVPVTVGNIIGPNPFPGDWRAQPRLCRALPAFLRTEADYSQLKPEPAHQWLEALLMNAEVPVTILMTGPASNLAKTVTHNPGLKAKISRVIWMGGAVEVRGNVAMHDHDGSAEWNAYWHPQATYDLLSAELPLVVVPLDATNRLPVSWPFLAELAKIKTPLAELAGQCWAATVTAIPAYEFTYFMWDVLATSLLTIDERALTIQAGYLTASVTTPDAGRMSVAPAGKGFACQWLTDVDADAVINYLFELLQTKKAVKLSFC